MALKEQFNHYYRIDPSTVKVDDSVLKIGFIVYPNEDERLKEKQMLPLYEKAKEELRVLLENANESNIQDLHNLNSSLYYSLYADTNDDFKEYALNVMKKYNYFSDLIPFINNPVKILYKAEINEYNYNKENPTLEDAYNILKTRIGNNMDV